MLFGPGREPMGSLDGLGRIALCEMARRHDQIFHHERAAAAEQEGERPVWQIGGFKLERRALRDVVDHLCQLVDAAARVGHPHAVPPARREPLAAERSPRRAGGRVAVHQRGPLDPPVHDQVAGCVGPPSAEVIGS